MEIGRVVGIYWSATGNTEKVTNCLAEELAAAFKCRKELIRFTLPEDRLNVLNLEPGDLAVVGSPVYAGKLPNKMLPDFRDKLRGNGTLTVGIVTFGNRSFDNGLAELCAVLTDGGFRTVAGGAFAARHAFTDRLASGRPDEKDLQEIKSFASAIAEKIRSLQEMPEPVQVEGDAGAPYYVPMGTDGQPAAFLKAKPKTDHDRCSGCGDCARVCPMGAVSREEPEEITGICIKCQACVRVCGRGAKYFDDAAFLSHVAMLEQNFARRAENRIFL